jgi:hypothetical protein
MSLRVEVAAAPLFLLQQIGQVNLIIFSKISMIAATIT